jgi:hypothetical protein
MAPWLIIAMAPPACTRKPQQPPAMAATLGFSREQADEALKAMVQAHPDAFHMASVTIRPEEANWFSVDSARHTYRIVIDSGACKFQYEGVFQLQDGRWSASEPSLTTIAHVRR